jgi:DNA-binding protein HU-beta
MNKNNLIETVALRTGLSRLVASRAVNGLLETIVETLVDGGRVSIVGFGSFELRERSARPWTNPLTGKFESVPAARIPKFSAGARLKASVN